MRSILGVLVIAMICMGATDEGCDSKLPPSQERSLADQTTIFSKQTEALTIQNDLLVRQVKALEEIAQELKMIRIQQPMGFPWVTKELQDKYMDQIMKQLWPHAETQK